MIKVEEGKNRIIIYRADCKITKENAEQLFKNVFEEALEKGQFCFYETWIKQYVYENHAEFVYEESPLEYEYFRDKYQQNYRKKYIKAETKSLLTPYKGRKYRKKRAEIRENEVKLIEQKAKLLRVPENQICEAYAKHKAAKLNEGVRNFCQCSNELGKYFKSMSETISSVVNRTITIDLEPSVVTDMIVPEIINRLYDWVCSMGYIISEGGCGAEYPESGKAVFRELINHLLMKGTDAEDTIDLQEVTDTVLALTEKYFCEDLFPDIIVDEEGEEDNDEGNNRIEEKDLLDYDLSGRETFFCPKYPCKTAELIINRKMRKNFLESYPEFASMLTTELGTIILNAISIASHNWIVRYMEGKNNAYCISEERFLEELQKNTRLFRLYQTEYLSIRQKEIIAGAMLRSLPEEVQNLYPVARSMKRRFVIHSGPTNSGKTYAALKSLKEAGSGIYLAPLRLLAIEKYEQLNAEGFPCSLLTGEEHEKVQDAVFRSSTIEMLRCTDLYKAAVIDEAQMLEDAGRGGSWTKAILGIAAENVYICAASYAVPVIIKLITMCGDQYEIVEHTRKTELLPAEPLNDFRKAERGDAFIVFSRKDAHAVAYDLTQLGWKCSIIYGALPYDVRRKQAELFTEGKTDILVATDAIGMGMNLPIRRIVFLQKTKFDGSNKRILKTSEIRQIAGRAGRRGIFETGYYTGLNEDLLQFLIKEGMEKEPEFIDTVYIDFPDSLLSIADSLPELLEVWQKHVFSNSLFKKGDIEELKKKAQYVAGRTDDIHLAYQLTVLHFADNNHCRNLWEKIVETETTGKHFMWEQEIENVHTLFYRGDYELVSSLCDLLYEYKASFGLTENPDEVENLRHEASVGIMEKFEKKGMEGRKCYECGRHLDWDYPYGLCSSCYASRKRVYREYGYGDEYYDYNETEKIYF